LIAEQAKFEKPSKSFAGPPTKETQNGICDFFGSANREQLLPLTPVSLSLKRFSGSFPGELDMAGLGRYRFTQLKDGIPRIRPNLVWKRSSGFRDGSGHAQYGFGIIHGSDKYVS